jgi:hypothetical protein
MKKNLFLTLTVLYSLALQLQSQNLPQPAFRFRSHFSAPVFSASGTDGQTVIMRFEGDSSQISTALINGYPAVKFDSAGFFHHATSALLDADKCLFLIACEPDDSKYRTEQGLWALKNGSRSRFLTSLRVGDGKSKSRYKYIFERGPVVTSNLFHFKEKADSAGFSLKDTLHVGQYDSIVFEGKIAEFMIIDKPLTETERQIWQGCLALKYGVTMYRGNYLNADGDTLWKYGGSEFYSAGVGE